MKPDEYDRLIEDPTGFLFNVWLPRVSKDVTPIGEPSTFRNNLSFSQGRDGHDAILRRIRPTKRHAAL